MSRDGWMPHWGGEGGEEMVKGRSQGPSQAGSTPGSGFGEVDFGRFWRFLARFGSVLWIPAFVWGDLLLWCSGEQDQSMVWVRVDFYRYFWS